jgi:hypothetical protein
MLNSEASSLSEDSSESNFFLAYFGFVGFFFAILGFGFRRLAEFLGLAPLASGFDTEEVVSSIFLFLGFLVTTLVSSGA